MSDHEDNAAAAPAEEVPGDDSELKNVQKEISDFKQTLQKYDIVELALKEDTPSRRLYDVLIKYEERLNKLQDKENILLKRKLQQENFDIENNDQLNTDDSLRQLPSGLVKDLVNIHKGCKEKQDASQRPSANFTVDFTANEFHGDQNAYSVAKCEEYIEVAKQANETDQAELLQSILDFKKKIAHTFSYKRQNVYGKLLETWTGLYESAPKVVRIVQNLSSSNSQGDSSGGSVSETFSSDCDGTPDGNVVEDNPPVLASSSVVSDCDRTHGDSSGGDVSETHSSESDRNGVETSPPVLASLYCNQVLLKRYSREIQGAGGQTNERSFVFHNYDWAFILPIPTESKCMNPALVYEVNINETKEATKSASQGRKGIQAKKSDYVLTCTGKDENDTIRTFQLVLREDKLKNDWDQQDWYKIVRCVRSIRFHDLSDELQPAAHVNRRRAFILGQITGNTVEFSVSICVANVDFILPLEQITIKNNQDSEMVENWEFKVLALHAAVSSIASSIADTLHNNCRVPDQFICPWCNQTHDELPIQHLCDIKEGEESQNTCVREQEGQSGKDKDEKDGDDDNLGFKQLLLGLHRSAGQSSAAGGVPPNPTPSKGTQKSNDQGNTRKVVLQSLLEERENGIQLWRAHVRQSREQRVVVKAVTRWTDQSIRSYFINESILHATLSNCAIASNCECVARVFDVIPALPHPTMPFEEVLDCLVVEELQEVVLGNLAQHKEVKQYMEDTLSGLSWLASRQIAHLDIKPSNVMKDLTKSKFKLIDFGWAQREQECHLVERPCGTKGYMAPECEKYTEINPSCASDMYSLGVVFDEVAFEMGVNSDVSAIVHELTCKMRHAEARKRISPSQASKHIRNIFAAEGEKTKAPRRKLRNTDPNVQYRKV